MATVRGHEGIYIKAKARKDYRCDGPHDTYFADPMIHVGDTYFRASLPPGSEFGYEGWTSMRLCWTCAPIPLTTGASR